jgi:hypothetical protein
MRFQRTFQISNLNLEISNYKYEYENMNSLIKKKLKHFTLEAHKHNTTILKFERSKFRFRISKQKNDHFLIS